MVHAVFPLTAVTATSDVAARQLIPGVEPGMGIRNIFAQRRMKRALLIRSVYLELTDWVLSVTIDHHQANVYLKLSQEADLGPGLLLPVARVSHAIIDDGVGATDQPATGVSPTVEQLGDRVAGEIFAPLWTGIRVVEAGSVNISGNVHLDYDVVEVPWEQWFIMWDFLDNVVDNSEDY